MAAVSNSRFHRFVFKVLQNTLRDIVHFLFTWLKTCILKCILKDPPRRLICIHIDFLKNIIYNKNVVLVSFFFFSRATNPSAKGTRPEVWRQAHVARYVNDERELNIVD